MKANYRRKENFEEPGINLTALIDVVFVILIMFILVAPLLELENVQLANSSSEPNSSSLSVQDRSPISIHVKQDNTVWINQQQVPLSQLSKRLRETKARYPQARPQLFHDRRAQFGTYQNVKNAAEAAGFDQMDVILNPV